MMGAFPLGLGFPGGMGMGGMGPVGMGGMGGMGVAGMGMGGYGVPSILPSFAYAFSFCPSL